MKAFLNLLFIVILLSHFLVPQSAQASFSDIEKHWAKQPIDKINAIGLVKGYPDKTYRPNQAVTYLEAITLVLNGTGYAEEIAKIKKVKNAPPSPYPVPWGQNYMDFAVKQNFLPQSILLNFSPDKPINRGELAYLLAKALYLGDEQPSRLFSDVNNSTPEILTAIISVQGLGLMSGYPDGTFRPSAQLSRAEVTAILGRLYDQGFLQVEPKRKVSGWVSSVKTVRNGTELELKSIYGNVKVQAGPSCQAFWQGQAHDLQQVVNYRIEGILDKGRKLAYLELLERRDFTPVQWEIYANYVRLAEGEPSIITVNNLLNEQIDYPIVWDAEVIDEKSAGKTTKSKDLIKKVKPGQFLKVGLTPGERVKSVVILNVKTITGEVASLQRNLQLKKSGSGNQTKYEPDHFWAWDSGRLINKDGDEISSLKVGDRVKVTYIGEPFYERVLEIQRLN